MKIYFGFTVAGDRSALATARRMVEALEDSGHIVLTRHLVGDDAWGTDRQIGPRDVYARDMRWLEESDIFIAEVSGSSFGLGYEAGYVLGGSQKRAILFYRAEAAEKISLLITGNTHPNCTLVPYTNAEEAVNFLRSGILASAV
jgi:hypothetical protein